MKYFNLVKSMPLIIAIVVGFVLSFFKHISIPMYLLSGVIFYFYIPMLYSYSRVNVFNHIRVQQFMHLKYYRMEFLFWLLVTSFFSFILAHLLADLSFGVEKPIHIIIYMLVLFYLIMIFYRELSAKKLHNIDEQINYERQGRLISFEILFVFILLFMMKH
jgi:hypothetical protein